MLKTKKMKLESQIGTSKKNHNSYTTTIHCAGSLRCKYPSPKWRQVQDAWILRLEQISVITPILRQLLICSSSDACRLLVFLLLKYLASNITELKICSKDCGSRHVLLLVPCSSLHPEATSGGQFLLLSPFDCSFCSNT